MGRSKCLGGLLAFAVLAPAVSAQDQTQRLQQEVDQLKATVQALQAEVKELKAERPPAPTAPAPLPTTPAQTAATQVPSTQVDALQLSHAERSPLPPQQSVSEDPDSASRIDNEAPPTDPTLKGFVRAFICMTCCEVSFPSARRSRLKNTHE